MMKIFGKYDYISDPIFTMNRVTDKKVILSFFSIHNQNYWCAKFQCCQSPCSGFLLIDDLFMTNIWRKYFSGYLFTVLHQPKVKLSN